MATIVPAIIEATRKDIMSEVAKVKFFVERVQIDVLDGVHAHTKSWPFSSVRARDELEILRSGKMKLVDGVSFELDLMVDRPEYFLDLFLGTGASMLIFHIDSTDMLSELIEKTKASGIDVGIALRPVHTLDILLPYLSMVDSVQFMGSDKIGYHGVSLDEGVYQRISDLRKRWADGIIAVDIGVNKETAPYLVDAGANKLVSGSAIFESEDIEESVQYFSSL